jgi:regulatory protein
VEEDSFNALYRHGIGYLTRREYSRFELAKKLARRCPNEALVEKVVSRLQEESYLSDERFVEAYIYSRSRKLYGPMRISLELGARGVSEVLIKEGLAAVEDWFGYADTAYRKKYAKQLKAESLDELLKRKRYLYSRGFDMGIVSEVLDAAQTSQTSQTSQISPIPQTSETTGISQR